jgi:RimJ/RimL family protein N-acetyltransferase
VSDELSLRPVTEGDLSFLAYLTNDPAGGGEFQWYGWHDPHRYRKQWAEDGLLNDDGGTLIISVGGDSVGLVAWRKAITSRISYCWNIGIILVPEARGKGYGGPAQWQLAAYLFAHSLVNRVEAATELTNEAEQRALEKAGFVREGVVRGGGFRDGQWRDGVVYSLLRSECSDNASLGLADATSSESGLVESSQ